MGVILCCPPLTIPNFRIIPITNCFLGNPKRYLVSSKTKVIPGLVCSLITNYANDVLSQSGDRYQQFMQILTFWFECKLIFFSALNITFGCQSMLFWNLFLADNLKLKISQNSIIILKCCIFSEFSPWPNYSQVEVLIRVIAQIYKHLSKLIFKATGKILNTILDWRWDFLFKTNWGCYK